MLEIDEFAREAPILRRSLHQELTARIREMIVEGRLQSGAKVPEKDLCASLGVSRTPLREALKVLASEGLIVLTPNRGASVTPLTKKDMVEVFPIIGALEALAGTLACEQITEPEIEEIETLQTEMVAHYAAANLPGYFKCNQAIHRSILAASRNTTLLSMHSALCSRIERGRYLANLSSERWRQAVHEHELILNALRDRSPKRLSQLLQSHFQHKLEAVLARLDISVSSDRRPDPSL